MTCDFCDIVSGRAPAHIVWQDDDVMVFADHQPIRAGHVQIIPKRHYSYFDDLPEPLIGLIVRLGQRLARAQKVIFGVPRVGFVFTGNDVPHCHAHLIPLHDAGDVTSLRYFDRVSVLKRRDLSVPSADLQQMAKRLGRALEEHHEDRI
ncbi:MAG: HIT family protein [Pseudomonadota bacterium]